MAAAHSSCSTLVNKSLFLPADAHLSKIPVKTHKRVRGYLDGCFDVMHSGHYNMFRQARDLCDELVVGVHDAKEIEKTKKCPPLQSNEERMALVASCKWVDFVFISPSYSPDYVALLDQLECDFCIHGSDVNLNAEGKDPFAEVKKLGKFRSIARLDSISSTEIITRLLKATSSDRREARRTEEEEDADSYLLTTDRLCQFMNTSRHRPHIPLDGQRVVYVSGSWDLFHSGHVRLLQEAKKLGDFLLVGIHEDSTVTNHGGAGQPIMNLFERAMNVLGCRDVDEIVFDAPFLVTRDMINFLHIDLVADCTLNIDYPHDSTDQLQQIRDDHEDHLKAARLVAKISSIVKGNKEEASRKNPYKIVKIELHERDVLTSQQLHERINKNRDFYLAKAGKTNIDAHKVEPKVNEETSHK